MHIENNVIKYYLRNAMFITGTAYAGKSTMCKMLAEKYDLYHCEENYNSDTIFSVITEENQPNLSYFGLKSSWEEFLNRSPEVYDSWIRGNSRELISFEIAEIIRVAADQKVIVDTNIPVSVLKQIADYKQIAVMLTSVEISVDKFFDRSDPEKQFLLNEISKCSDPEKTMENFRACTLYGSKRMYDELVDCGCFTIHRENLDTDPRWENLKLLTEHFGLELTS